MTAYEFIFSNDRKCRLARHLTFWGVFCISRFYLNLYPGKPSDLLNWDIYVYPLVLMLGFTPLHAFSIYVFVYLLLPRYLQKRKYAAFMAAACIVSIFNFMAAFFITVVLFKILGILPAGKENLFGYLRSGFYQGILLALSASCIVMGIKQAKNWYLQQIENTKLAKLKSDKEIQLLKAQIRPVFLLQSLNILRKTIIAGNDDAPGMVLQLADFLSYLLYDSKDQFIPLRKELDVLALLIYFEQKNRGDKSEVNIVIDGNAENKYITPLVLFSNLQNALSETEEKEPNSSIEISIHIKALSVNLCLAGLSTYNIEVNLYNGIMPAPFEDTNMLGNVNKNGYKAAIKT